MGIDISMSMGWGIHIPQDVFDEWIEGLDSGNGGDADGYEELNKLIYGQNSELDFEDASNGWTGEDNGVVIYARNTYMGFDMGREAEAGVYRAPKEPLSLPAQYQLNDVSKIITGEHLPIEWLVTVGVS